MFLSFHETLRAHCRRELGTHDYDVGGGFLPEDRAGQWQPCLRNAQHLLQRGVIWAIKEDDSPNRTEKRIGGQRVECAKLRRPEGPEAGILGSEIFLRVERAVGRVGAEAREAGWGGMEGPCVTSWGSAICPINNTWPLWYLADNKDLQEKLILLQDIYRAWSWNDTETKWRSSGLPSS